MNERIRELAEQAGAVFEKTNGLNDCPQDSLVDDEIQKFVELIVRECVDKIISKGTDWVDFAPSQTGVRPEYWDMAQQIKQHFGVEL